MKIKADFITNSSSTAYVVCIPDDWYPSDEVMEKASKWLAEDNEDSELPDKCLEEYKDKIMEFFDDLRRGQLLCMADIGTDFYYILCQCLNDDHIILYFEAGADAGWVEHIYKEKLIKILNFAYSGKSLIENISSAVLGGGDEN